MAGINVLEYAKLFQDTLDQKELQELTSGWMDVNSSMVRYNGGNEIKIATIATEGLGKYERKKNGFADAKATMVFKTYTFDMDRSAEFFLDRMDTDETNFLANAGNLLNVFEEEEVIPEVDSYRYSKLFTEANKDIASTGSYTLDAATIYTRLKQDISTVKNKIGGKIERLVITMPFNVLTTLELSSEISKKLDVTTFTAGGINTLVKTLDGIPIMAVSDDRMKTGYTFKDADGFEPTATAMDILYIIMTRDTAIAITKTDVIYIHEPGKHTQGDGFLIQARKYHTLFVPEQKRRNIFVRYASTVAPALTATVAKATGTGNTKFTATVTVGSTNVLAYSLTATAAAAKGYQNDIDTYDVNPYTSGVAIAAAIGQYLNMYEVDLQNRVVKFSQHLLVTADIT
jgi:hypothetical protein